MMMQHRSEEETPFVESAHSFDQIAFGFLRLLFDAPAHVRVEEHDTNKT